MKFPKLGLGKFFTQPVRSGLRLGLTRSHSGDVDVYEAEAPLIAKRRPIYPHGESEVKIYASESAPRAPTRWIPGASYFGWVPREEQVEIVAEAYPKPKKPSQSSYLVFEHPESRAKIYYSGKPILPIPRQNSKRTMDADRIKYDGRTGGRSNVTEREYNPADIIPYLNAPDPHVRGPFVVNLTGARVNKEGRVQNVPAELPKSKGRDNDSVLVRVDSDTHINTIDLLESKKGFPMPVLNMRSVFGENAIIGEARHSAKYAINPAAREATEHAAKLEYMAAYKAERDAQQKKYDEAFEIWRKDPLNTRSPREQGIEVGKTIGDLSEGLEKAGKVAHRKMNDEDLKAEKNQWGQPKVGLEPSNWDFTENSSEYAGKISDEEVEAVQRANEEQAEREDREYYHQFDRSRDKRGGFRDVDSANYYMRVLDKEGDHELGYEKDSTYLTHLPRRAPAEDTEEFMATHRPSDKETDEIVDSMEKHGVFKKKAD